MAIKSCAALRIWVAIGVTSLVGFASPARSESPHSPTAAASGRDLSIQQDGFLGKYFPSVEGHRHPGVLILHGSEAQPAAQWAESVCRGGCTCLALQYFGADPQPSQLDEVPIDYVQKSIEWLQNQPETDDGPVYLLGASKGAELALIVASLDKRIGGVVATAPSSVVFQGIPKVFWPPRSSWTYQGKALPFVPYKFDGFDPTNFDLLALYTTSLDQPAEVRTAAIAVERINGPILLFSGKDDRMWPSSKMADVVVARLKEKQFVHPFRHVAYEGAGHSFWGGAYGQANQLGGTADGNLHAAKDSTELTMRFLRGDFPHEPH